MSPALTPGRRALARAGRVVAAAVLAASATGLGASAPAPVRAALPALILVTSTTYEVLPEEGRVAVTVSITATNRLRDTVTRRFYYEEGVLLVQPEAANLRLTAETGEPSVAVTSRDERGAVLRLRFGSRLSAGKSMDLRLTFDLPDPGGAPDRPLRISPSLVRFQAWAHGSLDTPGSSVEVRVPGGYRVEIGRGPLAGPATDADGWHVYTSGTLEAPLLFAADVTADRAGGYVDERRLATLKDGVATLVIRAWPDDPDWRARVGDLFVRALAVLGDAIGAPWPFAGDLTVEETLVRGGGFAGTFDPAASLVRVGHAASTGVILHEAAHGWFNGRLVADRWIAEAFASYYAERAASALDLVIDTPEIADAPPEAALPLNGWPAAGTATAAQDAYGYAAALAVAREIGGLVGDERLSAVWAAAAAGMPAYQPSVTDAPSPAAETGARPPDWRALLDLLEGAPGQSVDAGLDRLWRRWIIRPADAELLDARADARASYAATVVASAPWILPSSIRDAMRAWQFEAAQRLLDGARAVLRERGLVAETAAAAGLTPPDALRLAFEGDGGFAAASAEAATELAVLVRLRDVGAQRIAAPGPVERLGLLGVDPDASLDAAGVAFEAGDLDGALDAAAEAEAAWQAVPEVARGRIVSGALLAAALLLLIGLVRRRQRPRSGWGH